MKDNLYRVTVKSENQWDKKKRSLYVVGDSKESVTKRLNGILKRGFVVDKIAYLGYDLTFGRTLFASGKEAL